MIVQMDTEASQIKFRSNTQGSSLAEDCRMELWSHCEAESHRFYSHSRNLL